VSTSNFFDELIVESDLLMVLCSCGALRKSAMRTDVTTTGPPLPHKPPLKSQAIQAAGQIWVSGQIPADAQGNLVGGSIADQTKACCEALKNILEDAGSGIERTVKVRELAMLKLRKNGSGSIGCSQFFFIDQRLYYHHGPLCGDELCLRKVLHS
jgi:hypothetical protein